MAAVPPVLVGTPVTAIQASGLTLTFTKPAGLANGDYLIACCRGQTTASATDWTATGFTRTPGPAFVASSAASRVIGMYYKLVTDATGEPSSYVFTVGGAASRAVGMLLVVRGVDSASPFLGPGSVYGGDVITNGRRVPAYTVPVPALVLFVGGNEFSSPNTHVPVTTPAGYGEVGLVTTSTNTGISRTAIWVGQANDLDGTAANADITWVATSGQAAVGVAARGTTASGRPKVWNGTAWVSKPAKAWTGAAWVEKPVKVWDGSTWKTLT